MIMEGWTHGQTDGGDNLCNGHFPTNYDKMLYAPSSAYAL